MWLLPAGARRAAVAFLFAAFFATLAITPGDAARPASQPQNAFVVGAILDLASGWTSLGRASRVTLQLAEADANAALARQGARLRVRLRVVDARGEPAIALRQLRRLARDRVRIVVGPEKSSEVAAVRRAATSLGVLVISQGSTAHSLAEASDNVFRFVPDDLREGEAVVALLRHDGIDAIVPVWRRDAGNTGLARSVRRKFLAVGGKVSKGVPYATKPTPFNAVASSISGQAALLRTAGAKHVGIYLAGFDEVVDLFRAARSDSTLQVPWYGSDGVALTTRLVNDQPAAAFAHSVGYPNPTVGLSDSLVRRAAPLLARARNRLGRNPDALALTAYDALRIAVEARQRAGTGGAATLRRALVAAANALLVGLPSPREVPLGSQLRVRRQPRRLGSNSAAHTLLTSNRRSPPSAPTHRFPARRERGCVESLGGVECPRGPLRCLPAEGPAEHPLASESNKAQPVVGQARSALRGEIQVDRQLLDECRVAWHALRLLESVGHERREHLQLSHPRADGDPDRDRARGNHDPWHLGEAGAPCECADDRHREHDNSLDVVRKCLRVGLAGKEPLAIGG